MAKSSNGVTPSFLEASFELKSQAKDEDEDVPERGHWTGRFDFLLACLGTAVGLGNVWRFPYLCYKNGGGAFLIPYIIMVFVVGLPVFLLELTVGQYSAFGPSKVFYNIAPIFKGIGYATIVAAVFVAVYYNMIIGWTIFYFFDSFRSDVAWNHCDHAFNTPNCFDKTASNCMDDSNVFYNRTCYNKTIADFLNITSINDALRKSSAEEYFEHYALEKSTGIDDLGGVHWPMFGTLFVAWVFCAICLIKGIKTSGKVVYFTATFPYLILLILFFRGITLPGAFEGLKYYFIPDFQRLSSIQVWNDAAVQVFYSFSIAGGGMLTYASYNKFHNNLVKDTLIIGFGDMLTSLFSGMVVFCMLGFMSDQLGKDIEDVVQSGPGLAFIVYPEGISRMPVSTLWAILFFFMLFLLGVDSQFAMVETIITWVFDDFPKTRKIKPLTVSVVCLIMFILGIPLTLNGGSYVLELLDNYAAGWPYMAIGLMECIVISYVYGVSNFMKDLKEMTGWNPGVWIRSHLYVTLATLSPAIIGILLLISWIEYQPLELGKYVFPTWANSLGWIIAFIPLVFIPSCAAHQMFKTRGYGLKTALALNTQPTEKWRANAKRSQIKDDLEIMRSSGGQYDNAAFSTEGSFPSSNPPTLRL